MAISRRRLLLLGGLSTLGVLAQACGAATPLPTYNWVDASPTPTGVRAVAPPTLPPLPIARAVPTASVVQSASAATPAAASPARKSNWRLSANRGTIKGFADKVSAAEGERVGLFVTTPALRFDVEVYRLGWYADGADEAQLVHKLTGMDGRTQPPPAYDRPTGMTSCAGWSRSAELAVAGWPTGIYLLKLIAADGDQNYVPLVVRDDARRHDFLFIHAAATDQAYNNWGGKSTYSDNSSDEKTIGGGRRAVKVSFDRPFDADGSGTNRTILGWELNMIRFLEANGFDVAYVSDPDVHRDPEFDQRVRAILMAGHSEYWSREMRDHLEATRDRGKGLGFFTGDTGGFAVRYEDSPLGKSRVLVTFKDSPDPDAAADPTRATTLWANPPLNSSSHHFIGIATNGLVRRSADWVVAGASTVPRLFAGTGLKDGDVVANLVGYEYDGLWTYGALREPLPGLAVLGRAHVAPEVVANTASPFAAQYDFAPERRPRVGRLSAKVDPGSGDWTTGSLTVVVETTAGTQALRYAPGEDAPRPYRADRGYASIYLGQGFDIPGWKTIDRDVLADYAALVRPPAGDLHIRALIFRGTGALGPIVLTPPDGEAVTLTMGDGPPEAAGWRVLEGQGQLTTAPVGPAGDRVLVAHAAPGERRDDEAHSVLVETGRGGLIFAAGTVQWSWALDAFGSRKDKEGRQTPVDPRMQALTRNILRALLGQR